METMTVVVVGSFQGEEMIVAAVVAMVIVVAMVTTIVVGVRVVKVVAATRLWVKWSGEESCNIENVNVVTT